MNGWVGHGGWLDWEKFHAPRVEPDTVTQPCTNRAGHRVTSLIWPTSLPTSPNRYCYSDRCNYVTMCMTKSLTVISLCIIPVVHQRSVLQCWVFPHTYTWTLKHTTAIWTLDTLMASMLSCLTSLAVQFYPGFCSKTGTLTEGLASCHFYASCSSRPLWLSTSVDDNLMSAWAVQLDWLWQIKVPHCS